MTRFRSLKAAALSLGLSLGLPAHGSSMGIPDSDSATLAAILFSQLKEAVDMGALLATTAQALETARQTSDMLRTTVEVYDEFTYLSANPEDIFDEVAQGFFTAFPELEAIATDAVALRNSLSGRHAPSGYNPYALQQLLMQAKETGQSTFQTLIAIDETAYGLTDEHLFSMATLSDIRETSAAIRRETMLPMTPQAAASLSAKANAQTAVAAAEAAAYQAEMLRIAKQQYVRGIDASARAAASVTEQAQGLQMVTDVVEGLTPFEDDTLANPYAPRSAR
ncbi:MAG: hypothetical protein ACO3JL_19560 [Myxococcota bacterium]